MKFFKLRTAYSEKGDSPWDALWHEGDDSDIDVLRSSFRVASVWNAPLIRLETRLRVPDFYVFQLGFAVNERVSRILSPLAGESVEFLPLRVPKRDLLFAFHPLRRVDLDDKAMTKPEEVGENITVIRKYSFRADEFDGKDLHVFQVRQARGSPGRDAGFACSGVLVSEEFRALCEENKLLGMGFEKIWESG